MIIIGIAVLSFYYIDKQRQEHFSNIIVTEVISKLLYSIPLTRNIEVLYHLIEKHKNNNNYEFCIVNRMAK
jgi:hypothetical protein